MDAQNCSLKFASWSQEVTKVSIASRYLQEEDWAQGTLSHLFKRFQLNLVIGTSISTHKIMSLYSINKEYELKEFYALRHETPDPCCKDDFADVT